MIDEALFIKTGVIAGLYALFVFLVIPVFIMLSGHLRMLFWRRRIIKRFVGFKDYKEGRKALKKSGRNRDSCMFDCQS